MSTSSLQLLIIISGLTFNVGMVAKSKQPDKMQVMYNKKQQDAWSMHSEYCIISVNQIYFFIVVQKKLQYVVSIYR